MRCIRVPDASPRLYSRRHHRHRCRPWAKPDLLHAVVLYALSLSSFPVLFRTIPAVKVRHADIDDSPLASSITSLAWTSGELNEFGIRRNDRGVSASQINTEREYRRWGEKEVYTILASEKLIFSSCSGRKTPIVWTIRVLVAMSGGGTLCLKF